MLSHLQKLGLTSKESAIYMAAMELGVASPVATIAKKANINRTTAYDILEQLVHKGIVVTSKKSSSRYYEALPPEKIIAYLKEQSEKFSRLAQDAEKILPELKAHYQVSGRPKVYFYEGDEGLIRVYEETLTSSEEITAYASDQANQEAIPWYFPQYYKRRAAKGIPIRGLFPDLPKNRERHLLDKKEMRNSRLVPLNKLDFTPEINFFDNKIMIADWKGKLGIIIESAEISKVFKQTFELAWEAAEKYHKKIRKEMECKS
ncbi:MAG: helix-turn-helix domain-containing protein [Patescibacteria group bacterium]|mgnify:CR=1 FL=1